MRWETLTYPDFEGAVRACAGVGIVPIGVIEPHGAHLPLGTDTNTAHWIACHAAEREPAVAFPPYSWGVNHEGAHLPGSVVIKRELLFQLLQNVCDEMARHGLKRIVLISGHGGNRYFLPLFVQTMVEEERDYVVYYGDPPRLSTTDVIESDETGHACERETSTSLVIEPENVRMDAVPEPFTSRRDNAALKEVGAYSPVDWYSMYPNMYVGDASRATVEKGEALLEDRVASLTKLLAAVKADEVTPALMGRFYAGARSPSSPY
jgi:creatinine amidohydrolase